MREGPFDPNSHKKIIDEKEMDVPYIDLKHKPVFYPEKKIFIFDYNMKAI